MNCLNCNCLFFVDLPARVQQGQFSAITGFCLHLQSDLQLLRDGRGRHTGTALTDGGSASDL